MKEEHQDLVSALKEAFSYPKNKDFIVRELHVRALNRKAVLLFLAGMADMKKIESDILGALLTTELPGLRTSASTAIMQRVLTANSVRKIDEVKVMVDEIIVGNTLLVIEGLSGAITITTTGFEHRGVGKPQNENVLKGPLEAFIESGAVNRSLIRKQMRSPHLISESVVIGEQSNSEVTLMYLGNIVDQQLLQDVKDRIKQIKADTVQTLGMLEQHIEERPYSLVPSVLYTERPDRAVGMLAEGHIVLVMDSSPAVLVVPVTFWSFFQTSEDYIERWAYGNFIRLIRLFAMFVALLTPAIYIAITNFHVEMIPTDLLLAIAATRERVPFPALIEVLIMEAAFELLREAGVRIPTPIGPTIGIVGALILGQAAVDANVISPILVIVVAITGLASFAVPNISFNFLVRITRFVFLFLAAFMGFFGITIALTIGVAYLVTLKSFGVPFLSPLAPPKPSSGDMLMRPPIWKQWLRPFHLNPQDPVRNEKSNGGGMPEGGGKQ